MAHLKLGQHVISYDVHGDGAPLVMLRGLGRCVKHWLGYEKLLAERFRVITLDLRGIGGTTLPLGIRDDVFDQAQDVVRVLDELKIDAAHLLGVSLGGMVTLAAGLRFPERFRSLITINTSIGGLRTLRISPRAIYALTTGLLGSGSKIHDQLAHVLTSPAFPDARRPGFAAEMRKIAEDDGLFVGTVLKQLVLALRFKAKDELHKLKMPVLLVYGADDRFVPNINTRKIKALIPGARLAAIANAGHEVMIDQPQALRELITDWIDELEAASGQILPGATLKMPSKGR